MYDIFNTVSLIMTFSVLLVSYMKQRLNNTTAVINFITGNILVYGGLYAKMRGTFTHE